jgi:hypothetical protein
MKIKKKSNGNNLSTLRVPTASQQEVEDEIAAFEAELAEELGQ